MCTYILATLPQNSDAARVAELADQHGLAWTERDDPRDAAELGKGERCFHTTRGQCDCGTELGSCPPEEEQRLDRYMDQQIKKRKNMGWSPTKIKRWLEQQEQYKQRKQHEAEQAASSPGPEIDRWLSFLRAVIRSGASRRIGIYVSWGGHLSLRERKRVTVARVTGEDLLALEQDVLYEFTE